MNLVYGAAGEHQVHTSNFAGIVHGQYGQDSEVLGCDANLTLACSRDADGVALGIAKSEDGKLHLAMIGCLNHPVPDWRHESPLDDPNTAAEYLLQRYRERGESFADGIVGQFAIAVRDEERGAIILSCDPTGIRSLFYVVQNGNLRFSSNLAVLASATPNISLNRDREDFLLCYGYIPQAGTLYEGIEYLKPGSVAIFEYGRLQIKSSKHGFVWQEEFPDLNAVFSSEETALPALKRALELATEQQLASDNKAAVLLGGADSALVASLLHRAGKEVETFSFFYEDARFNQPHIDTLTRFLGTRHTWVPISKDMLRQGLQTYPWTFNFPTNWPNYVIQTEALARTIRDAGFRYIYSGDGCDGSFLGYPRTHVFSRFLDTVGKTPEAVVKAAARTLDSRFAERHGGRLYTLALNALRSSGRAMPERGYSNFKVMDENTLARLKGDDPSQMAMANEAVLRKLASGFEEASPERLAYAGKNALSPNRSKLAGSSDSTGTVINSPYLHSGLKQFALSIPDHLLRPKGDKSSYNGKYLLFKACEVYDLLPKEVIYQAKISAVDAPVDAWYVNELRPEFRDAFSHLPFPNTAHAVSTLESGLSDKIYRSHISSDALTSHPACLLATYARFAELIEEQQVAG